VTEKNKSDEDTIQRLYESYKKELCAFLVGKYSLDFNQAEDIVQTAFVRLSEASSTTAVENPRALLYKICTNIVIDKIRHDRVRGKYIDDEADVEEPYTEIGPEDEIESRERLEIIADAIRKMPDKRRELLLMKGFDGLSYAEVARRAGLSETVVRKHISKALEDCYRALTLRKK
jgi:RNA polymerase sigma factor (sigma-70 family)